MELIARDEAKRKITEELDSIDHVPSWVFKKLERIIGSLPTVEERNEGEWIHDIHYGLKLPEHRCSICGEWEYSDTESKYCPNCGARMIGE